MTVFILPSREKHKATIVADLKSRGIEAKAMLIGVIRAEASVSDVSFLQGDRRVIDIEDGDKEISGDAEQSFRISNDEVNSTGNWAKARIVRRNKPWPTTGLYREVDTYWESERTGVGVDIYILDTGVDSTHVDLAGRVTHLSNATGAANPPSGFDDGQGHGTAVASFAAGILSGPAPDSQIYSVKITNSSTGGTSTIDSMASGIEVALTDYIARAASNRPAIANLSYGGSVASATIQTAATACLNNGLILLNSAGNELLNCGFTGYSNGSPEYGYSAWYGVFGVGGHNINDNLYANGQASGTNWGSCIPIYAPAQRLRGARTSYIAGNNITYFNGSGTSYAAPTIAGILACMMQGHDRPSTAAEANIFLEKLLRRSTKMRMGLNVGISRIAKNLTPVNNRVAYLDPYESLEDLSRNEPPAYDHHAKRVSILYDFHGTDGATSVTDLSGKGHVATFVGSSEIRDNVLQIRGGNSYITIPYNANLLFNDRTNKAWTVETEVTIHDLNTASTAARLFRLGTNPLSISVIVADTGHLAAFIGTSSPSYNIASPASWEIGEPIRIAITYDGVHVRTYVNGRCGRAWLVENLGSNLSSPTAGALTIGRDNSADTYDVDFSYFRITPGACRYWDEVELDMMDPVDGGDGGFVASVRAQNAATTSMNITIPSSTEEGDLIHITVLHRSTLTIPSGYTAVTTNQFGSSTIQWTTVLYKLAGPTDAGTNVTLATSSSGRIEAVLQVHRSPSGWDIAETMEVIRTSETLSDIRGIFEIPSFAMEHGDLNIVSYSQVAVTASAYTSVAAPGFSGASLFWGSDLRTHGDYRYYRDQDPVHCNLWTGYTTNTTSVGVINMRFRHL